MNKPNFWRIAFVILFTAGLTILMFGCSASMPAIHIIDKASEKLLKANLFYMCNKARIGDLRDVLQTQTQIDAYNQLCGSYLNKNFIRSLPNDAAN